MATKALWWFALALLVCLTRDLAWAGREKLDAPLGVLASSGTARCKIIAQLALPSGYRGRPYGWVAGDAANLRGLGARLAALNGNVYEQLPAIRGIAADVPAAALDALADDPRLERISQDWSMRGHLDLTCGILGATQAQSAYGVDGTGVGVAVIDSGVYSHRDLSRADGKGSRITGWCDLVNGRPMPYDDSGHGTHVAGIIGGNGSSSTAAGCTRTFRGIAPNCNLVGVKALDADNTAPTSRIIRAVQWCIDNRTTYNIRVVNLSVGHAAGESSDTDPLDRAVEQVIEAGIVVVCSAGNRGYGGYGTISVPGNSPGVITVGAVKHGGSASRLAHQLCGFSSRGPTLVDHWLKPEIVSVGNRVISLRAPGSTLDRSYPGNQVAPGLYGGAHGDAPVYFTLSGTSMAAATVAGAVALMIEREPALTPATVKLRLMESAEKVTFADIYGRGCGYLEIGAALKCTDAAASPIWLQCWRNAGGTVTIRCRSSGGDPLLSDLSLLLGGNFAWGESNASAQSVVWTSTGLTTEEFAAGESEVSGSGES